MGSGHDRRYSAFLSYPVAADKPPGLAPEVEQPIGRWRDTLQDLVRDRLGDDNFEIFMDRRSISVGQAWEQRLREGLDNASLLIVLVMPRTLKSKWCREELAAFFESEAKAGRNDLVFPVLWVDTPELYVGSNDELASKLAGRQYIDWRSYRFTTKYDTEALRKLDELAQAIVQRLTSASNPAPKPTVSRSDQGVAPKVHPEVFSGPSRDVSKALHNFLLSAFSVDELRRLIRWNYPDLSGELPEGPVAPAAFTAAVVELLHRRGEIGPRLYGLLRNERPRRAAEIEALSG